MCDHCRSARTENAMTGLHEKAMGFGRSLEESSATSRSQRPEVPAADGACCAQWRKTCCGGGCCDSTTSSSPCCGPRQPAGTVRQSQPSQYRKSMYRAENGGGPSGYAQFGRPAGRLDCNRNGGYPTNETAASRGLGGPTSGTGVCPAMMRNLPCTPIIEPKCFGGDCRDDDTDSEHSREI